MHIFPLYWLCVRRYGIRKPFYVLPCCHKRKICINIWRNLLSLTKNTAIKNKQEQTKQSFEISNQIVITKIQLVDKQLLSGFFLQRTIIQVYVLNQCLVTYNNR